MKDLIDVQRFTGARAGELLKLTKQQLDMTGKVWLFNVDGHKTVHHGHSRIIAIGAKAQKILKRRMKSLDDDQRVFPIRRDSYTLAVSPATALSYCRQHFGRLAREARQEEFWIVKLSTKNEPIDRHQITVGTLRISPVHPREVFRPAIRDEANCILVMHNHPSGDAAQVSAQQSDSARRPDRWY